MDSTTATTTSVSSTTSTPPIAYPSSHINSPVLNNNWADEVEAFFGDGIVHYPDNEPTLQPQLADFTDLELNLSDDEDMFSPPTVRFQFPSRATPSTSANASTPINSTSSELPSCSSSSSTSLIVDLPPPEPRNHSTPIAEGTYVFSLFDHGVFTIIKQINADKARCRSVIDFKFRPVRSYSELTVLNIPGVIFPNKAAEMRKELIYLRRSSEMQLNKDKDMQNSTHHLKRDLLHPRSENDNLKRENQLNQNIQASLKANVGEMENELTTVKSQLNKSIQPEEKQTTELWAAEAKLKQLQAELHTKSQDIDRIRKERNKLKALHEESKRQAEQSENCSGYCQHLERLTNVVAELIETQEATHKRKKRSSTSKSHSKKKRVTTRRRSPSTSSSSRSRSSRS